MKAHRLRYSLQTLYKIKADMKDFSVSSRAMNTLKENGIAKKRRGKRAGLQYRTNKTRVSNFSYPYGMSAYINSIQGKFIHLEQTVINRRNLCFIAPQETKIQSYEKNWAENETPQHQVTDEALHHQGYYMFRHDRQFSANGGGLITYIAKEWCRNYPKVCANLSMRILSYSHSGFANVSYRARYQTLL
ncbi:hypothetical protein HOLleu_40631 [Holothuria leucospilota]|uniref:Uncharacterized protein n=1 Tax=Holothuria leucospilota TaxID=206669 RepID=A0A9Q1BD00_HOLLE|nr:hypothetical protein HOLleu_40631 [Holothuria leucospilota]